MRAAAGNVAAAVAAASLDETVDAKVDLLLPAPPAAGGGAPPPALASGPVCLFLPGFLLSARRSYRTLAAHLASHGFPAALVDMEDPSASDAATARAVAAAAAACAARCVGVAKAGGGGSKSSAGNPTPSVLLLGHSRGAKIAALAAGEWERLAPKGNGSVGPRGVPPLAGLVLLDPVDRATLGPPPGPSYPSALPAMRALAARGLPILIVGAGDNGDIVEQSAGWQSFAAAAAAGAQGGASGNARAVELLLPRAKHLDFADTQSDPLVGGLLAVAGNIFGGAGGVVGGGANADRPPSEALAVRRCADAVSAFWASKAAAASAADIEAEVAALRRLLVPDARARVIAWPKGGGGGGDGAAPPSSAAPVGGDGGPLRREELLALRASQLQSILRERGVYFGDCFDKPSLVERVLASSSSSSLSGGGGGRQ